MKLIEPVAVTDTGTFSRASTATYWDANGVLQTAAVDEPRWQWDPATGEFEGLLVEDEATNLLTYSAQFDDAAWTKTRSSVSANAVVAPDGTTTSDKLVEDTSVTTTHLLSRSLTFTAGLSYVLSVFFKPAERPAIELRFASGAFSSNQAMEFDADTGVTTVAAGTPTGSMLELADGWWYCTMTATAATTASSAINLRISNGATTAYTGDGVSGIYIWGAQLEVGTESTSYIPTTGTAVLRYADDLGDAMMLSNIPETDETEYNPATAYDIGDRCMITTASQHNVYESLTAANTGNDPTLEVDPIDAPVNWQFVGKTNVWKPFDNYGSSQASVADRMVYSIVVPTGTLVDSVVLMNVDATEARIVITDADAGEVYNEAHDLVSESGIIDYWEYFFAPVRKMKNLTVTDLDVYAGVRVDVELTQSGDDVLLGVLVIGLGNEIGATMYGLRLSSTDYSVKRIDGAGNVTLTERPYSDEMSMQVWVDNPNLAAVKEQLNRVRATPIVYIGADHYGEATTVYGWHESWDTVISYPNDSILSANIKGLT